MAKKIRDGKLFYHVTAIDNLTSIFKHGLCSRIFVQENNLLKTDVAREDILEKRKELGIADYVPFHFFEPTAFTGAIFKNNPGTTFCTITISREFARNNGFKICTAHPLSLNPKAEILSYDDGMAEINWSEAEKRDYKDEVSKNACMAECLAPSPVLPDSFYIIFVPDENTKNAVEAEAERAIGDYKFDVMINSCLSKAKI